MLKMVDLHGQYLKIKNQIDQAVLETIDSTMFIGGAQVQAFSKNLSTYLSVKHVIPCANGTDALQIAMMALDLKRGDEVILPAFTYVATAEVIGLLGLKPVMVDVNADTFNIDIKKLKAAITSKTKAIVPVHLFGQSADMEAIMQVAKERNLYVIEDNAQALGSEYRYKDGSRVKTGTIGHVGCTSFFPAKNLGCYGDGGAIFTNDDALAIKLRQIANHGQSATLYQHDVIGVNSRLDAIQAAVLNVKLPYLDAYCEARAKVAVQYDKAFKKQKELVIPRKSIFSSHVYHQYTLLVKNGQRDALKAHLAAKEIPSMIYYPIPLYAQKAYEQFWKKSKRLKVTEQLCNEVISLPIHTEMKEEDQKRIIEGVLSFFA
jgi:UDP-2-acetamido-2-deoxy-ribo-hexuluronate aminotransferase